MKHLTPVTPKNLNPFARELLEALAGHPESAEIVLGGGVALSHYLEYRPTVDVDAWWKGDVQSGSGQLIERTMATLAANHGLALRVRRWKDTESFELLQGTKKKFSFQISTRDLYLAELHRCDWTPMFIEDFRDNIASKLRALAERGAPRDFSDIYEVCRHGLVTAEECWQLYEDKNPGKTASEGKRKTLSHLAEIEHRRPLNHVPAAERSKAELVRHWFRVTFCANDMP